MAAAAGALTTGLFFHPHFSLPTAKATGGSNDQGGKFNYRQQKVIAGAESLICHHLLHLIQVKMGLYLNRS
ncbi:hypothetical protein ACT4UM_23985 [Bacillus sp. SS-TM]